MSKAGAIEAFWRILASVGASADAIGSRPVVSHWPHRGSDGKDVLIVGQAVYGWPDDWRATDADDEPGRTAILQSTLTRNADREEPMGWIEHSDRYETPFWRSCQLLAEGLRSTSVAPWWGRFTWANLYPVAWEADPTAHPGSPTSRPGNPTGSLKAAQDPFVADLLAETIDWLDPEVVIVFGGPYWWPASRAAPGLAERDRPLIQAGSVDGRRWVVGWHPNGANRRGWTPDRYVGLILEALEANVDWSANPRPHQQGSRDGASAR